MNAPGWAYPAQYYAGITGSAPSNTVAPVISGTVALGSPLTCSTGSWIDDGAPIFALQWQRDNGGGWTDISGQTGSTYTPTGGDGGYRFRCNVTDTDGHGSTLATSNIVGPYPAGELRCRTLIR